jgi:hypothetical protein
MIVDAINNFTTEDGQFIEHQLIYLDKNHSPSVLVKLRDFIDTLEVDLENVSIHKTCLIPHCIKPHVFNGQQYPFSLQLLVTCFLRVLNRQNHITLTNDNPELVCRVLFGFFNSFRQLAFNESFKETFSIDTFLELNITNETLDIQLPPNLVDIAN